MCTWLRSFRSLDMLPDSWEEYEARACRILFRGPTGWMQPGCLRALKHLGFPVELPDMRCHTTAAKCRMMKYEDRVRGGFQVLARARALDTLLSHYDSNLPLSWLGWAQHSFLHNIGGAHTQLVTMDPTLEAVRKLAGEDPDTRRSKWQRACYQVLRPAHADGALRHLRRRLDRWDVEILQGRRVGRAVLALRALSTQVPPRVLGAVLCV